MEVTVNLLPEEIAVLDRLAKMNKVSRSQAMKLQFEKVNRDAIDAERCMGNIAHYERTGRSKSIRAVARKYGIQ